MSFSSLASLGAPYLETLHTVEDAASTLRNGAANTALRHSLLNSQRSVGEVTYESS